MGGGQGLLAGPPTWGLSRRLAALLLTPFGALLAFGVVVPVAMLFAFSFFHLSLLELVPGFTIDNYRQVVSTPLYRTYAINTFLIAAPTALLSVDRWATSWRTSSRSAHGGHAGSSWSRS